MRYFLSLILMARCIPALGQQDSLVDFLSKNQQQLQSFQEKNLTIGDDFFKNRYFFFGETHGSALPQKYDLSLFKLVHEKANVNYYIAEVDDTKAWMLNNFMKDGNKKWLDQVFASWIKDTAQWANREYYKKFEDMRLYYQSASKKFTILGIDVPQDYSLIATQTDILLANKNFGKYQPQIDSLKTICHLSETKKELIPFSKRLLPIIENDPRIFMSAMGDGYKSFLHLLTSFTFIGAGMTRDSVMFRNLADLQKLTLKPTDKLYGFLGYYHCLQTGYNNALPFAYLLKRNDKKRSGIVSIQMFSLDNKAMLPLSVQMKKMMPASELERSFKESPDFPKQEKYLPYILSNDHMMMTVEGIGTLRKITQPNSVTLFRLSGKGSPFASSKMFAEIGGFQTLKLTDKSTPTADAFQYILLFRNSPAATPLIPAQ